MANAANVLTQGDPRRRLKDKLARLSVIGGGLVVLFALLLIFFYLAYVVFPLFKSPDVTIDTRLDIPLSGVPAQLGIDENNQFGFRYSDTGELVVFSLNEKPETLLQQQLVFSPTSFFAASTAAGKVAYGLNNGEVSLYRLRFLAHYQNGTRQFTPDIQPLQTVDLSEGRRQYRRCLFRWKATICWWRASLPMS